MMTNKELHLAAELLDLAADRFGNHGCNDFVMGDDWPLDELVALDKAMHEQNGDPHEHEPEAVNRYQTDFALMHYMAHRLREMEGDGDG